ncbi:hypothetical protein NL89_04575 [Bifidobacterium longum subsp. longum]|uniref:hypothetical protein n=1 Tax=Bifidobacterium longum TaxID=216816 RepID=UPI0005428205|nr:hypothetical protein [Bifidobacterium longum]KHD95352.1 hypothetical protein NL89_04575 [Bifidobacterium longum subsp. longum]
MRYDADPIGSMLCRDGREILECAPPDGFCAVTVRDGRLAFVTAIDTTITEVHARLRRHAEQWLADPHSPIPADVTCVTRDVAYPTAGGWRIRDAAF